jgi:hypothetical protein
MAEESDKKVSNRSNAGTNSMESCELNTSSPASVGRFDCYMEFSESYLDSLLKQSAPAWEGIADADAWLQEIRGSSDS